MSTVAELAGTDQSEMEENAYAFLLKDDTGNQTSNRIHVSSNKIHVDKIYASSNNLAPSTKLSASEVNRSSTSKKFSKTVLASIIPTEFI